MLYLIKGRAGSGKTNLLRKKIVEVLQKTGSKPLLIIPEQFSFETERSLLKLLGSQDFKKADIYSFSRMAFSVLKGTEHLSADFPDDGVRAVLMSEALNQLDGELRIFNSCKSNATALAPLVDFCKELKYCCIDSDELLEKSALLGDCYLKNKLSELNLINEAYNALVTQSYFDDTDAVHLLSEVSAENGFFKNRTVFIDGFRAFSKQEIECLEVIFSQADNVYITLCTDKNVGRFSCFSFIKQFENRLRGIAARHNLPVEEIFCTQSENAFSSDIFQLEKNLFSDFETEPRETDGSITVAECSDSDGECEFVAATVKKLLRSGKYRCRDIAIIERTSDTYKSKLIEALKRLDIPVFDDSRRSLSYETLFVYMNAVLLCISSGFNSENIFNYLKTGFSELTLSEVSKLEKYVLIWGINGKSWLKDFTMHPDGFGNELDETALKKLKKLNSLREKAVIPLVELKKECENKDGKGICEAIYRFLESRDIPKKLFSLYNALNSDGFPTEAQRQKVSWDVLMNLLDSMAVLGEGKYFGISRWVELFEILVESRDIGEIPQGLDEIKVGSADRIRVDQMKVVFLVGVNKDEFPLVSINNGILTDADRVTLTSLGLEIRPPFEDTVDEERFISYCAVTAASEKLFLTFKTSDGAGEKAFKSEIIDSVLKSVSDVRYIVTSESDPMYFVENDSTAFALLSKNFNINSSLKSTLLKYFSDKDEYYGKLTALRNICSKTPLKFNDESVSEKLFGKNMYLSASRVESFNNCAFAYFMRYGLKAEPLRTAELDSAQSGTVVHLVMETVLKKYPKASFVNASESELRETVSNVLETYLNEKMGGGEEKSKRFMFLFERLADVSMAVINRLKSEFEVGSFEPHDFELKIGGDEIPAYKLPLENGEVTVTGSVDRVDMMEKDGIKYLRVIDYKTGKKEFKLSELFDGINIQMVLYLMALQKNGTDYFGETVPAGVLYLPSRIGVSNYLLNRSPSKENVAAQKRISGKLSGMVLGSPVVFNGMGVDKYPDYYPVSYKSDGSYKGNYYSLENFRKLSEKIDVKIADMGNALHKGEVGAVPYGSDGEGKMCKYCPYKLVCGHEYGDKIRDAISLTHGKALERLEGKSNEQKLD